MIVVKLLLIQSFFLSDQELRIEFADALAQEIISAEVVGMGGHSGGEVISLTVQNICSRPILLTVPPGHRFKTHNEGVQDILVTGKKVIRILPRQVVTARIPGYCCQAYNSGPAAGELFFTGGKADSMLCRLARFIDEHPGLPADAVQHAIWVISDKISIGSIHCDDKNSRDTLQRYVSMLTGLPVLNPEYSVLYEEDENSLFTGRALKIFVDFRYTITAQGYASLYVRDKNKKVKMTLFTNQFHHRGAYIFPSEINVADWEKASYTFALIFHNRLIKEKKIDL